MHQMMMKHLVLCQTILKVNMQRACENTQSARPTRKRENTRGRKHRKNSQYSKHFFWTLSAHPEDKCRKVANGRGAQQVFGSKMEQKHMQNLRRNGLQQP